MFCRQSFRYEPTSIVNKKFQYEVHTTSNLRRINWNMGLSDGENAQMRPCHGLGQRLQRSSALCWGSNLCLLNRLFPIKLLYNAVFNVVSKSVDGFVRFTSHDSSVILGLYLGGHGSGLKKNHFIQANILITFFSH